MCRFVLYIGPPIRLAELTTEPSNSIIHQSYHAREREEPLNGDGFGLAWYVPEVHPDAVLFRSIRPAWSNENLRHVARATRSHCVLAHVRAANPGMPVTHTNTHPFVWRRYAFMHNGVIAGFHRLRRALLGRLGEEAYGMIQGTTDTEHLFALFLDHMLRNADTGRAPDEPEDAMAAALVAAVHDVLAIQRDLGIDGPSRLNLAVADGERAVVCRFSHPESAKTNTLYLHAGKPYVGVDGTTRMEPVENRIAAVVASEPLSDDSDWLAVPPGEMVLINPDRTTEMRPFRP